MSTNLGISAAKTRRLRITKDRHARWKTSENEDVAMPIPIDLVLEILSRLPVKSIARSRCVSKLWSSILCRPDFTEMFLTRSYAAPPKILYVFPRNEKIYFFSSLQPQNPDANPSPLNAELLMPFPMEEDDGMFSRIGGLYAYLHKQSGAGRTESTQMICNPSTGKYLVLPKVKTRRINVYSYFGYDPIGKQYKVLSMTSKLCKGICEFKEFQVLTLGAEKPRWRMIECCIPHTSLTREGICIDGVLYYLAWHKSLETNVIVCFDVRNEKFSYFEDVDTHISQIALSTGTLIDYNGKLGFLHNDVSGMADGRSQCLELIVIGDFKEQEWSKKTYEIDGNETLLNFVGVTRTNEIVLSFCQPSMPICLFYYNTEKRTLTRVEVEGIVADYEIQIFLHHVEDVNLIRG